MASLRLRPRTAEAIVTRLLSIETKSDKQYDQVSFGLGDLTLDLVADGGSHVSSVSVSSLAKVGLTPDTALNMARAALARETDGNQWCGDKGVFISGYGDEYDFARLLAAGGGPDCFPFSGRPIVYAPSYGFCLATEQRDAATIGAMVRVGDSMAEGDRAVLASAVDLAGRWSMDSIPARF